MAARRRIREAAKHRSHVDATEARSNLGLLTTALQESQEYVSLLGTKEMPLAFIEAASVYEQSDLADGIPVSMEEARKRWSDVLDAVVHQRAEVNLTKHGKTVLVLYPNIEAPLPYQDLLNRSEAFDTDADEDEAPRPPSADMGEKIDALGNRLEASMRNLADTIADRIEERINPVRRMMTARWREADGRHPRLASA